LGKNHIDLAALKRDRDQIWGEASARLAKGEPYMLKREFWLVSKAEQEQRLVVDPWEDKLLNIPPARIQTTADGTQRVPTSVLLGEILNIAVAQQTGAHSRRLAYVMRRLGWERSVWRDGDKTHRGWMRMKPKPAQPAAKAPDDEIPF
jgi:predicted P-loop ATPase